MEVMYASNARSIYLPALRVSGTVDLLEYQSILDIVVRPLKPQQVNQTNMTDFNEKFDATGLNCPLPILRAKKVLTSMDSGQTLYVISTDSGSVKDFDAFCKQTGNELLESTEADGKYHYYIKKA